MEGYWGLTIGDCDRIVDQIEQVAARLSQSKHTREAADLREARDAVKAVRDDLIARQHDVDRGKERV